MSAALLAVTLVACSGNKAQKEAENYLKEKAKATAVPQNIGAGSTLTACSYADNLLSYRIVTTADSLNAINVDTLKSNTIRNWKTNLNTQEILEKVIAVGAKVKYTYVSGTDSIVLTLVPEDFK